MGNCLAFHVVAIMYRPDMAGLWCFHELEARELAASADNPVACGAVSTGFRALDRQSGDLGRFPCRTTTDGLAELDPQASDPEFQVGES
jgi:hypothetical protein